MKCRFDHIEINMKNLDKGMKLFKDLFGWELPKKGSYSKLEVVKYAMLHTNDHAKIQLYDRPEDKEGATVGFCIEVDDIEEFYDRMKEKGLAPTDVPPGKKYRIRPSGAKIFRLPKEKVLGMNIEILERDWNSY